MDLSTALGPFYLWHVLLQGIYHRREVIIASATVAVGIRHTRTSTWLAGACQVSIWPITASVPELVVLNGSVRLVFLMRATACVTYRGGIRE